jgi:hypothetical protein
VLASLLLIVDPHLLKILQEGDFGGGPFLLRNEEGSAVDQRSNLEKLDKLRIGRKALRRKFLRIGIDFGGFAVPNLGQDHFIHCQCSRFI